MRTVYKISAQLIFLIHSALFLLVLTGYLFPGLWYYYMGVLLLAFVSDLLFGYCLLSKWEFQLRKKWNQNIDYNYSFASYYTYKLTNKRMNDTFYRFAAVSFLGLSFFINLYFKLH